MNRFIQIAIVFIFCSCTDGLERLPGGENVLPREKMIEVMTDLVKLESHIQLNYRNVGEYHKVMITSGDSLLKRHGVSRQELNASMDYYASRQDEMQAIYGEVLDRMNREMGELQSN